ncbi:MAG: mechanosensitive ion channel family protein [Clostridiales bacterium]|nr:mechanosensitive ion channel family protein [Clostridiales bacterium]
MSMLSTLPIPVQTIIVIAIVIIVTLAAKKILPKLQPKNHRLQTMISLLYSTIQYIAAIVCLIWILKITGADVNTILASVGIVALIVGFSAESLIADVITGLFMIFENQFNVGDVVEIDGYRGTVENIGIRTISVRDSGDNVKIVNNSNIKNMVNLSTDVSRAVCDMRISYEEDLEQVEKILDDILEESFEKHNDIFLKKPVYIGVQDLHLRAVIVRIVAEVEEENIFSGRRILNREIYLGLEKRGVHIPYKS